MKINGISLDKILLKANLVQFQSVPQEAQIEHTFSPKFKKRIRRTNQKSQNPVWRIWQIPAVQAMVIALLIIAILAAIVCTVPAVRNGIMRLLITDPKSPHIPQVTETYYIPTFEPEGFELVYRNRYRPGVTYYWANDQDEHIWYTQIPEEKDHSRIEATDGTTRTVKIINGHSVDIIANETTGSCTAQWNDDRYIYEVKVHLNDQDPYFVCEALIQSLSAVGAAK